MDHRVVILKGVGVDPLLTCLSQSEIGHGLTKEIYCPGWTIGIQLKSCKVGGSSKTAIFQ